MYYSEYVLFILYYKIRSCGANQLFLEGQTIINDTKLPNILFN